MCWYNEYGKFWHKMFQCPKLCDVGNMAVYSDNQLSTGFEHAETKVPVVATNIEYSAVF